MPGAGRAAASQTPQDFQGFPICSQQSPQPRAWSPRAATVTSRAAPLRDGRQPSRSLSQVSWNRYISTKHINQGVLIEWHLAAGKSLQRWRGAVCSIPCVQRARSAAWEGMWSQTPAVGREQRLPFPISSCASSTQTTLRLALQMQLLETCSLETGTYAGLFLPLCCSSLLFFLEFVKIFVFPVTWLKGKSRRVMVSHNCTISIKSQQLTR